MSEHRCEEVSVIVCTRGRPQLVRDTVRSILAGTLRPVEIVVIDQSPEPDHGLGGAGDTTTPIRYHWSSERGLARARNVGAALASRPMLVYCDDDMLADPDWLEATLSAMGAAQDAVVTGRVIAGQPERARAFVPATVLDEAPAVYRGRLDRDVLAGGNVAISAALLVAVGGWDDRLGPGSSFPSAEDNDLGYRLLEAGYQIVYEPRALLLHRAWRGPLHYPLVRWRYGAGKGGFYAKHASLRDRHVIKRACRDVGKRFPRALAAVWRRPVRACGEVTYAAGVLAGFARWLASERVRRR